tara:strand:+ start:33273 stop:33599 length:327 start_codon:yes stop_codon:yes gene_type:complete
MQVEFTIQDKLYAIQHNFNPSVPMVTFNFLFKDGSGKWIDTGAGKQWNLSSQDSKGGIKGYVLWLLMSINDWLSKNEPDFEPESDSEKVLAFIRDNVIVVEGKFQIKE